MQHIAKDSRNSGNSHTSTSSESMKANATVSHEFSMFLADMENLIKASTSLTGDDLARAKADINDRISAAKESLDGVSSNIAHRVKKAADISNHYVHEQPWQIIAAGSVIGLLLGFMVSRRS